MEKKEEKRKTDSADTDDIRIEQTCRSRHQHGVKAIEDAAVPGQDVAGVLHTTRPLDHRLHEVAKRAEKDYDQSEAHPLQRTPMDVIIKITDISEGDRGRHCQHQRDNKALPCLLGGDALAQLVPSEKAAGAKERRIAKASKFLYINPLYDGQLLKQQAK